VLIAISRAPTLLTWFTLVNCGVVLSHAAGHAFEAKPFFLLGAKQRASKPMKVSAKCRRQVFVQNPARDLGTSDKSTQTRRRRFRQLGKPEKKKKKIC